MKTLFFTFGIVLMATAFIFSFIGLRMKRFPAGPAMAAVIGLFLLLVLGTATFAVGYSNDEQSARDANEASAAKSEAAGAGAPGETSPPNSTTPAQVVQGPGGTVKLSASPTDLAFDTTKLTSKPGKVTISFDNPSSISHNVAIVQGSKTLDQSPTISQSTTEASATLAPGKYTFLCTIPGHAEAGMQGVLTVK